MHFNDVDDKIISNLKIKYLSSLILVIQLITSCSCTFRLPGSELLYPHHLQKWPEQQPQVTPLLLPLQVLTKPSASIFDFFKMRTHMPKLAHGLCLFFPSITAAVCERKSRFECWYRCFQSFFYASQKVLPVVKGLHLISVCVCVGANMCELY